MTVRIAINGFGRIGRMITRVAMQRTDVELVAVNDLTDVATLAHLFKYDSVHRAYPGTVEIIDGDMHIDGKRVKDLSEPDPSKLPWGELGVDIVLECTGRFRTKQTASKHIEAGAKKVIVSAPGKGVDATIVVGVNDADLDVVNHTVVSCGSCTTNCLAPLAKALHEAIGIETGLMTTIHSYTSDQVLLDAPHSDLRRARSAALSMVPTTTGAASAVAEVLPALKGKLDGMAIRVPTPNVSIVDFVFNAGRATSAEEVNAVVKAAADGALKGILQYETQPLVSIDMCGNPHSSIFDAELTSVMGDRMVKVLSWYDNEFGFSNRMVDLAVKFAG
ncbi:MAG: type I glyceraldehyde-3-phosphate dehydrogenase [Myxococcales bacterium]|nr:type I glyceraldehyde-3-phosphate dehydrogenase [Myxococcales bacterium]MCB9530557.1 type I glyceraldehyde-3-phosphate dehydrogenase [Myxococcales bacterium]